jgi:hypothetical protein
MNSKILPVNPNFVNGSQSAQGSTLTPPEKNVLANFQATLQYCDKQFDTFIKDRRTAISRLGLETLEIKHDLTTLEKIEDGLKQLRTTKVENNQQLLQLQTKLDQLIVDMFDLYIKPYALTKILDSDLAANNLEEFAKLVSEANLRLTEVNYGAAWYTHINNHTLLAPQVVHSDYFNSNELGSEDNFKGDITLTVSVKVYFDDHSESTFESRVELIVGQLERVFSLIPTNLTPAELSRALFNFTTSDLAPVGCINSSKVTQLSQLPATVVFNYCVGIAAYMIYHAKDGLNQASNNYDIMDAMFDFSILWHENLDQSKNIIHYFFEALLKSNRIELKTGYQYQSQHPTEFFKSKCKIIMEAIQTYLFKQGLCLSKRKFLTVQMLQNEPTYLVYWQIIHNLKAEFENLKGRNKRIIFLSKVHHELWRYCQENPTTSPPAGILHPLTLDFLIEKANIFNRDKGKKVTLQLAENA